MVRVLAAAAVVCAASMARGGVVEEWNQAALDAIVANKVFSNPGSRVLASMHLAQWKAVQDVAASKKVTIEQAKKDAALQPELEVAIASAGHKVLTEMFPPSNVTAKQLYDKHVGARANLKMAVEAGSKAAQSLIAERAKDGFDATLPEYKGVEDVGKWRSTPPAFAPGLMMQWANITPFAMTSHSQFRSDAPPPVNADSYKCCYDEVLVVGSSSRSNRTDDQTDAAKYWAVNPEVLWAKITQLVTSNMSLVDSAHVHAVAAAASADSRIASWDTKWTYLAWRPVTAIRVGNAQNWESDPAWESLLATPPTPEWPSAHTATAEAVAFVLRNFTGSDNFAFSLESYGLPGKPRAFTSFTQATEEIGRARVWAGVHYTHSIIEATSQGRKIGEQAIAVFGGPSARRSRRAARHLRST